MSNVKDTELLRDILSDKTSSPISKLEFVNFAQSVTLDFENIAYVEACTSKIDEDYARIYEGEERNPLMILVNQNSSTNNVTRSQGNLSKSMKSIANLVVGKNENVEIPENLLNSRAFEEWSTSAMKQIINDFLVNGSPNELNIDGNISSAVREAFEHGELDPSVLDPSLKAVFKNILDNTLRRFKKEQMSTNIGEADRRIRFIVGITGSLFSVLGLVLIFALPSSIYWMRLVMLLPLGTMYAGYIQYRNKFCVMHGAKNTLSMAKSVKDMVYVKVKDSCVMANLFYDTNVIDYRDVNTAHSMVLE
ncbi:hypothetical protein ROZALSC1DRAFT_29110 [Rozella allomycis CSF55]|uniref:RGS domain-containing protein n=1 Tax=Rozella allomycis (strain CSF55) TaxID=988480 RepID=A0A4P9YL92_ROZAC|nr:hypothetical protein ROZALSC1DRAFT_29110 [Rozella allomycis CSF55]